MEILSARRRSITAVPHTPLLSVCLRNLDLRTAWSLGCIPIGKLEESNRQLLAPIVNLPLNSLLVTVKFASRRRLKPHHFLQSTDV